MGPWSTYVVPRLADFFLGMKGPTEARERVCTGLAGDVVEVGFGSGRNTAHYPAAVTGVWAVEPSEVARRLAARRLREASTPVTWAGLDGQRLDLPDDRFDAALSTWTLCTIPDVEAALSELRRVLKPGGVFHFVEHGRSPDASVHRWQQRLQPINGRLAGGCRLERPIADLVTGAGFELESLTTSYAKGDPKPFGYTYEGRARS
ncbi:MAG TPA: class I SAM-dependent methyltransferase [Mycobacteriales bacterium]|nr:class I SAM-dependent methyltransferase [Mycobacteriales bacterium]